MKDGVRGTGNGQTDSVCVPLLPPTDLDWTATLRNLALPGVKKRGGGGKGGRGGGGGGGGEGQKQRRKGRDGREVGDGGNRESKE